MTPDPLDLIKKLRKDVSEQESEQGSHINLASGEDFEEQLLPIESKEDTQVFDETAPLSTGRNRTISPMLLGETIDYEDKSGSSSNIFNGAYPQHFNWAAALIPGVWSIFNCSFAKWWWIETSSLILYFFSFPWNLLNLGWRIYCGANGNKWAWEKEKCNSAQEFNRHQKRWARWATGLFLIFCIILVGQFYYKPFDESGELTETMTRALATQGDAKAQYELGDMYKYQYIKGEGLNYPEARKWFELSAKQGNKEAQFELGMLHYLGHGVEVNYTEAHKWWLMAAKQGDKKSQNLLGGIYKLGKGVPVDYVEARKWLLLAAKQGHGDAQWRLGDLYASGQGGSVDYIQAYKWSKLSAEQGYRAAKDTLKEFEQKMTPQQIKEAQRLARDWKPSNPE